MQILQYTDEHRVFRDAVRRFLDREVVPFADQWEAEGFVPRSVWRKIGEQGFLCMDVPEEYGGLGADLLYSVILTEELVRSNLRGLILSLHSDIVVPYITANASEELKRQLLPRCISGECITAIAMTEPNAGSDLAAMQTTATTEGGTIILNGQKAFVSNGSSCDLVVVAARNPSARTAYEGLDLYLVEDGTPGFEKGARVRKVGWHSQDTAELFFADCRIPITHRLGAEGTGFMLLMQHLQRERLMCCIMAVALAEQMLETTIEYCRQRTAFGQRISGFQHNQFMIVDMATDIRLARTFVDTQIRAYMEGEEITADVSMAKAWTAEMVNRVAGRCVQLHGAYGYCEEYPIARAWRDARVFTIFGGTNEIMKDIAARFLGL